MNYSNKLIVSKSNPILVPNQNHSVYTVNSHLHSSSSSHNLNKEHVELVNNVEEIREADIRLQEGIYEARSKLLKTLKVGREISISHSHEVNWEYIIEQKNERIRQLEFELHEAKTRIIQMQSMFQEKEMEIQKFLLIIRELEQKLRVILMEKDKSSENDRLINELRMLNSERDSLIIKMKEFEKDKNGQIANLSFTIKELQNRYDSFESLKNTQIDELTSKIEICNKEISKFSEKEEYYVSLMKATEEYQFLNSQLGEQLKNKNEEIRELEERIKFLDFKNKEQSQQITNLETKYSMLDSNLNRAQESLRLNAELQDETKQSKNKTELLENELTLKETIISELNSQYAKNQEEWKLKELKWINDEKTWRQREQSLDQSVRELMEKQLNWEEKEKQCKSKELKWLSNDKEFKQLVEKLEQEIKGKNEEITKLELSINQLSSENLRLVGQVKEMQNAGGKEKELLENLRGAEDFIEELQKELNKVKGIWNKEREEMNVLKNELKKYELFEKELETEKNKNKNLNEELEYNKNQYQVSMENIEKVNQKLKEAESSQHLLNSQNQKITELESVLNSQRSKMQDVESFSKNDRNKMFELESLLNAERLRSTDLQSQINTQATQIEQANKQTISNAELQIQGHISEKNRYLSENTSLLSEIEKLRNMLDLKEREKLEEIKKMGQLSENSNVSLEFERKKIIEYESIIKQNESKFTMMEEQINRLKLTISNLEAQIHNFNHNNNQSEELLKIQIENQFLKQRLIELEKSILLNSDQQLRIEQLEQENANIIEQINFLSQELKRLNSELQRLSAELQRNSSLYETERDKLLKENSLITEKKEELHRNLISAESSMKKYLEQIQEQKLQIEREVEKNNVLTSQQKDKIQLENDRNESERQQLQLRQTINELNIENAKLKQELNALQQKLDNSEKKQNQNIEKVSQTGSELDELKNRILLLEKTISSHNSLIESLQNDQNSLRNEKSEIERVKDQLGINVRNLSDDLELSQKREREVKAKLEEKIKELTDSLNEMGIELAGLKEEKLELEAQLKAAQLYQNSLLDDLNDKLIDIERGKSSIYLSLEKKRLERELNIKIEEASNKIEQLETQLRLPLSSQSQHTSQQITKTNQEEVNNNSNIIFEQQEHKILLLQNLLVERDEEIKLLHNEKSLALKESNVLHLELEGIRDELNVSSANVQERMATEIQKINQQFSLKTQNYETQIQGYDATIKEQNETIVNLQQIIENFNIKSSTVHQTFEGSSGLTEKNSELQQANFQLTNEKFKLHSEFDVNQINFIRLQEEFKVATDELDTQTQKLVSMEQNLFNAENYIEEQEKQIMSLKQNIEILSNSSSNIISELNNKINSLESCSNNLAKEQEQRDKVIDEYKQKIFILETNETLMSKSKGESSSELIQLNNELARLKEEQQNEIVLFGNQINEMQKSLSEKENEINSKNSLIQNYILALTEKDALFNNEQSKHLIKVGQMQREIDEYDMRIEETIEMKKNYENNLRDCESVRIENSSLLIALNMKEQENIELKEQETNLSAILSSNQQKLSTLKAHSENLENIVKQISTENSNLITEIQLVHSNLTHQISEREEYIQGLRNDLTHSEENNDEITVALGQQKQEISAMIMEIANLQMIGKKNEGEENELVNSLKNQLSESQREKLDESKLLQNEILNLKKHVNAIEREKYEVEVQIQNIDNRHQALVVNYEGLKQALQNIVEVQEIEAKNETSPIKNIHYSPFKNSSIDQFAIQQSDIESRQVFNNIKRVEVLLAESNARIYELISVNEELNRRLQENENAFRQLLEKVNNEKGERSGESSVIFGFGDHPLKVESVTSTEISNIHQHDEGIRNENEMLKKTVSILESELSNKTNSQLIIEEVHKMSENLFKFNIHDQHHEIFYPSINELSHLNTAIWQKLSHISTQNRSTNPININQHTVHEKSSDELGQNERSILEERYEEVLQELILFESRNKELINEINWLHNELNKYKIQVQELETNNTHHNSHNEFELKNNTIGFNIDLKQNNFNLSKEEETLKQNPSHLSQITEIELNSKRWSEPQHSQYKHHINQLELLEQQLLQNEKEINNSCENVDIALKDIKGLIDKDDEDTIDKTKIKKLLDSLEVNIKENQKLHKNEISNMANTFNFGDKSDRFPSDDGEIVNVLIEEGKDEIGYKTERVVISDRVQLIKEVKELRRLINIFDYEAKKRKAYHDQTVNGFRNEILKLQDLYGEALHETNVVIIEGSAQERLMLKMDEISSQLEEQLQQTSRNEESRESLNFGEVEEKDILIRGQGVEIGNFMESVRNSLNENDEKKSDISIMQNMITQANFDVKPFLDYVLQNNDFDKEDLLELKRKVASLKSKQNRNNMNYLSSRKEEMEMLFEANKHLLNSKVDINQFMEAIADNVESSEIIQIFLNNQNNANFFNTISEVLNTESIGQQQHERQTFEQFNLELIAEEIREIMLKYSPEGSKMGETLYQFILLMLASKSDDALLNVLDNFFSVVIEIEQFYLSAIDEKDRMFQEHKEVMNKMLEKSSSEGSEEGEDGSMNFREQIEEVEYKVNNEG